MKNDFPPDYYLIFCVCCVLQFLFPPIVSRGPALFAVAHNLRLIIHKFSRNVIIYFSPPLDSSLGQLSRYKANHIALMQINMWTFHKDYLLIYGIVFIKHNQQCNVIFPCFEIQMNSDVAIAVAASTLGLSVTSPFALPLDHEFLLIWTLLGSCTTDITQTTI